MHHRLATTFALSTGLLTAAVVAASPAQTEPVDGAFVAALAEAGVTAVDPASAAALGQQVCPMLADPGQTAADVTSKVAEAGGMSLGPATMFTGVAISMFCPAMMSSIGSPGSLDSLPIPLSILGF
ncbi:DUF732 domain-containing protein [Mycobacterium sp. 29Ha]|uniref:DUF732 domain-containing protein n=1 Tax=Mycobacterium sp. 29Ha TaxID=2939268 RepID=UPI002939068C|nr:DUF732 domain-containing protein [Mycobacterium sp. 29Ha]MDV3133104.1 DUF732 domain-containing protein [Mycobacterium sp. 29Ha]